MKKVAFVISSLDLGGAQRAVSSITMGLSQDYDIDIIINNTDDVVYPYRGRLCSLNIANPKDRNKPSIFFQAQVLSKRILYLRKAKRQNNYDAVISFLDSANVANILSGNKYCKCIISVRNNVTESLTSLKKKILIGGNVRYLYNRADGIISLSDGAAIDLINNYGIRPELVRTIYNGYDYAAIERKSREKSAVAVDAGCVNFVTMGRLTHQKGQWHLIRAFAEAYKSNQNIRLYILGIGELEEYLCKLINDCKLADQIKMVGFEDNPYSVLKEMDAFIFPSIYEGFGNAMLEAMTCGLPCISTDYESGAREILGAPGQEQYGLIVSKLSGRHYRADEPLEKGEQELSTAMLRLAQDDNLRKQLGEKARLRASRFSIESAIACWEEVI